MPMTRLALFTALIATLAAVFSPSSRFAKGCSKWSFLEGPEGICFCPAPPARIGESVDPSVRFPHDRRTDAAGDASLSLYAMADETRARAS